MTRRRRNVEVMEATAATIPVPTVAPSQDYEAMAEGLRTHSITVRFPNGKKHTFEGYFSRRAANIDAKALTQKLRDDVSPDTHLTKTGKIRNDVPVHTKKEKKSKKEVGYFFDSDKGNAATKTRNPRHRIRHNTHFPVGTAVNYKGKAAKVKAQHENDVYTVRFDKTGAVMRVPGFLLERR